MLLKEIWNVTEAEDTKDKKPKKDKKDKSAHKYLNYVAGNTVMKSVCAGKLSGEKKD